MYICVLLCCCVCDPQGMINYNKNDRFVFVSHFYFANLKIVLLSYFILNLFRCSFTRICKTHQPQPMTHNGPTNHVPFVNQSEILGYMFFFLICFKEIYCVKNDRQREIKLWFYMRLMIVHCLVGFYMFNFCMRSE